MISAGIQATLSAAGALNYSQAFVYDGLNRLKSAIEAGGSSNEWSQAYDYDRWGNRVVSAGTKPNPDWTPTDLSKYQNNQWMRGAGDSYDAAGNQQSLGTAASPGTASSTFGYDAENRLTAASVGGVSASYGYDGEGRRVWKVANSTSTVMVYDADGLLAAEYSTAAPPILGTEYLMADALGSGRLVLSDQGSVLQRMDYLPFGEEVSAGVGGRGVDYTSGQYPSGGDLTDQKFTGKERDAETGLDWFGERYSSAAQGRFTSPDGLIMKKEWLSDPQRWNHYAYVRNNPLRFVDSNGEDLTVVYSYGPDIDDNQKKWFEANKATIFAAIQQKFNDAGVKNVVFKSADSLSKDDLKKLASSPIGGDNRTTGITGAVQLQVTGAQDSIRSTEAPLGVLGATYHGQSDVYMDRLGDAGSATCDTVCAFANVAAHEIGHGLGFDDPGHSSAPFGTGFLNGISVPEGFRRLFGGAPDIMMQGQDPAKQPYNFNMGKDKNVKAVQEVNRVGGYPR